MSEKFTKIRRGSGAIISHAGISLILFLGLTLICLEVPTNAAVTVDPTDSDVDPANPATWTDGDDGNSGYIGKTSAGSLTITEGSLVECKIGYVGYGVDAVGTVTINDISSRFEAHGVNNGGNIYIGHSGTGTINIGNDGSMSNSLIGYIGYSSGSEGTVNVVGTGGYGAQMSRWYTCGLRIGSSGGGALNITNGGEVIHTKTHTITERRSYVGYSTSGIGVVTVDGQYSLWENTGDIIVGNYGSGTVIVRNGGTVTANPDYYDIDCYIGYYDDAMGSVTVNGTYSTWTNDGDLYVGYGATGTTSPIVEGGILIITDGGEVSNSDGCIGYDSNSTGKVTVDGTDSKWTNSGNLMVGDDGVATLTITNSGLVTVGTSAGGVLTVDDDNDDDSFINIGSEGKLSLYSTSSVTTLSEFYNLISGTDAIRYWDGDSWEPLTSAATGYYTVSYDDVNDYATLAATSKLLGDANGDGVVSAGDYASVQANFGNTGEPGIPGDANWDGIVSAGDYASIQANFGHCLP